MRKLIITSLVLATGAGGLAGTSSAADRAVPQHFEGTVTSVDRGARTFRIRTERGANRFFRVVRSTTFERIGGFAGVRRGLRIEVDARRIGGVLTASHVERRRGGGGGGNGGGGGDDGPGHT